MASPRRVDQEKQGARLPYCGSRETSENICRESLNCLPDNAQQRLAIGIILEDRLSTITAPCYMADSAGKFDS